MSSSNVLQEINDTIEKIEKAQINQQSLNELYFNVKNIFLKEIKNLPDKPSSLNKKIKKSKPFWNKELSDL